MRRFALLLAGVAMLGFAVGCSCLCPGYGGGYGNACGYGGCPPSNPCGPTGCGPAGCPPGTLGAPGMMPGAVTMPPQGAYHTTYDTMQAGIPGAMPMTASQPVSYTAGYPQTAAATPMESLPTY